MGELKDWADKQSDFLRIEPGGTVEVKYLGYKIVANRFDVDQETVRYYFEVDGLEKTFESRSLKLAEVFDGLEIGSWVSITRTGEKSKTRYEMEVVGEDKDEEIEKELDKVFNSAKNEK